MDSDTKVVVVGAEPLVNAALGRLLSEQFAVSTVPADRRREADGQPERAEYQAAVAVVDVAQSGPPGTHYIAELRRAAPHCSVVAIVSLSTAEEVADLFAAGASGVVSRDAAPDELVRAVREVATGHAFASRSALQAVLTRLAPAPTGTLSPHKALLEALTDRERTAVALLVRGLTNQEIATAMYVSPSTVKVHLGSVMAKWGVRDRLQVALRALGVEVSIEGLISGP
ncbi:LuxR C-terminal-related transcriptional regulator [Microbacterium sp. NPDC057407]|uniref:response regulator transcription factor n=1 Tax=Microbacterium sp. NPDC057407 TaxID=3346120 RepID=UPI00366F032F